MSYSIFKTRELIPRSFLQRIFNQHPIDNAIIELNNLLATTHLDKISVDQISTIETQYNCKLADEFKLNIQEFYAVYLNYCLEDKNLSENDLQDLKHLSKILKLDKREINMLHEKIGSIAYRKIYKNALTNGILSDAEEKRLKNLSTSLSLDQKTTSNIVDETNTKYIKDYVDNIIENLEYSTQDEQKLVKIAKDINADLNLPPKVESQLDKLKHYSQIENSELNIVPTVESLQKDEVCYFKIQNATWYEYRRAIPYKEKIDIEANIQLAKKAHVHGISKTVKSESSKLKYVDAGTLYITNKRILMIGEVKNSNIRLEKISDFFCFIDGVGINKNTGKPVALNFYNYSDLFCIILGRILKDH